MLDREVSCDPNATVDNLIGRVLNKLAKDEMSDEDSKIKTMDVSDYGLAVFLECLLRNGTV